MKKQIKKETELRFGSYILKPTTGFRDLFDLSQVVVNKKGKTVKKQLGYGYKFANALESIISRQVVDDNEMVTLKEYIDLFGAKVDKLKAIKR